MRQGLEVTVLAVVLAVLLAGCTAGENPETGSGDEPGDESIPPLTPAVYVERNDTDEDPAQELGVAVAGWDDNVPYRFSGTVDILVRPPPDCNNTRPQEDPTATRTLEVTPDDFENGTRFGSTGRSMPYVAAWFDDDALGEPGCYRAETQVEFDHDWPAWRRSQSAWKTFTYE